MATATNKKDTKKRSKRGSGKAIVARMENVDGKSGVLLASSKKRALSTTLHWNQDAKKAGDAFILTMVIPDGNGGMESVYKYVGKAQGQALYEVHPRRVPVETLPPSCPLAVKPA